jgi:ADP-ribose pyrophosphatase
MSQQKKERVEAQTLAKDTVFQSKWAKVLEEKYKLPNGNEEKYLVIEKASGVMILPITEENGIIYTYLVQQYRYPIGKEILQFPMGSIESQGEPGEQAAKELKQETGLIAKELKLATKYYVDPGLSRQVCYVFIADGIAAQTEQELEETEQGLEVKKVSIEKLETMIEKGDITDAWVYAGMYILKQYLKKRKSTTHGKEE